MFVFDFQIVRDLNNCAYFRNAGKLEYFQHCLAIYFSKIKIFGNIKFLQLFSERIY